MQQLLKLGVPFVIGAAVLGWQWPADRAALPQVQLDDQAPAAAPAQPAVQPLDATALKSASATIDKLVMAQLGKQNLKPLGRASDEVFLRRAYLDLIGRIPTLDEAQAFFDQKTSDKREKLV